MGWNSNKSSINGLQVVTGVTTITGSAVTQTFAGISTISRVIMQPCQKLSAASGGYVVNVNAGSNYDIEWPVSGVTNVGIQVLEADIEANSAVSLQYIVLGT